MGDIAELQLKLRRLTTGRYLVESTASDPGQDQETGLKAPVTLALDPEEIAGNIDPEKYAAALTDGLFNPSEPNTPSLLREEFLRVRALSLDKNQPLRVRLLLDSADPELHGLRWETLLDPQSRAPLFNGDLTYLSRYLYGASGGRPVTLRAKGTLRALVAVAHPSDLDQWNLADFDPAAELQAAVAGLGDIPARQVPDAAGAALAGVPIERCTLSHLVELLREGVPGDRGYDIFYLVCHGQYVDGASWLFLEDEAGKVHRVRGEELARRIGDLLNSPRLVVLVSCQSAGDGEGQAFTALGPLLAEAGVPAVVAMQGRISMQTTEAFMPAFFKELDTHGIIDRAVAVARGHVKGLGRLDYWMPVLYMRLTSGRLWRVPGAAGGQKSFEKWPALIRRLKLKECTPILGPGVLEWLSCANSSIAAAWASRFGYPLRPYEVNRLPQVAQFVYVQQENDRGLITEELMKDMARMMRERYARRLPDALKAENAALEGLLDFAAELRGAGGQVEPNALLAGLNLPIYITANFDLLLVRALEKQGKKPRVVISPWNQDAEDILSDFGLDVVGSQNLDLTDPNHALHARPTPDSPLVYYLFGNFEHPETLVLTEDDYFEFLIGVTRNKDLVPIPIREALAKNALLFVGFKLDEWDFRVIHRSIMAQQGSGNRQFKSVGVQVDLDGGEITQPERAGRYLEEYFDDADISLFWGNVDEFINDLAVEWKKGA